MKRTDLGVVVERFRDEAGACPRRSLACSKSGSSEGVLGWAMEVEVVGKPRNWDVRSSY